MERSYIGIRNKETGERIAELIRKNGLSVKDVQEVIGLEHPQAIYRWLRGETIPSIDNLVILSKDVFHNTIDEILVYDEGPDV